MEPDSELNAVRDHFSAIFDEYGPTPQGMNWNSTAAQEIRFEQLARIINSSEQNPTYSLIDYGSGYGALLEFLVRKGHQVNFYGFDIAENSLDHGRELYKSYPSCTFTSDEASLPTTDYVVASGIFNKKLETDEQTWERYVLKVLDKMNSLSTIGFAFNLLTSYSDPEYMRPELYYANPLFFFDHCKKHYAKDIAILHDYGIYDFTILVRKQVP